VSFERTKKVAKKPDEKHLVTFDSELRRLKSNKKPILNGSCYVSQQKAIFDLISVNQIKD